MFIQYEPNVKALITFLRLLRVKVNNSTVDETLQNHPNWPSLLCLSDALHQWQVPNAAGKTDKAAIDELPVPFMAYTNNPSAPIAIVTKITTTNVHVYANNYTKPATIAKADFIQTWHGVYLIAEANTVSGEKNYTAVRRKTILKKVIPSAAIVLLTAVSFILLTTTLTAPRYLLAVNTTGIYLQYLILVTGVLVTSLLLWYEIDRNNPLLNKVCTGISKGDCTALLTGKQARLFKGLSWSEVGFFYFSGGLLTLFLAGTYLTGAITIVAWLNILALPYTIFSVYYQWQVAKQWCVLCLMVQALLLLGGINCMANNYLLPIQAIDITIIAKTIPLYALPVLLWYAIKPYILKLQEAKTTKREYLRIKFNTEIFNTLVEKQKRISYKANELGINIGNKQAKHTLIKVCSPTCGPCGKSHKKLTTLLEKVPDLNIKIIFTTPNDDTHTAYKPARHLMAIAAGPGNIEAALNDWYLPEKKDYEKFAEKYPVIEDLFHQDKKLQAMSEWCRSMEITATPTFFINQHQLPDAYSIEDLEYFLLE
jgi:hypothetical protein